jgi:predicted peroxiredoxin
MATFIISGSRGTDDPTMATLPFMAAKTAKEQGHDVVLWLWNEAVTSARKGSADHVVGVNLTPLKDLLAAVQAANIPIWVCGACAVARQIGQGILSREPSSKGCRITSRQWLSATGPWRSNSAGRGWVFAWRPTDNRQEK